MVPIPLQRVNEDKKPQITDAGSFPEDNEGEILAYHDTKALRMKIDLVLLPFLCGIYFLQYLDKT